MHRPYNILTFSSEMNYDTPTVVGLEKTVIGSDSLLGPRHILQMPLDLVR